MAIIISKSKNRRGTLGFTMIELVITIGITTVITMLIATLQRDLIVMNGIMQSSFSAQQDARKAFKIMTAEVRIAQFAANGAFPLEETAEQSITFFADADANGVTERIRYFISGTNLMRGNIIASGNPTVYDVNNETITTVAAKIANGTTPVFQYYDNTYDGTSAALSQPVISSSVRLIKITLIIDPDSGRPPGPQTYTTQVSLRNLKENL